MFKQYISSSIRIKFCALVTILLIVLNTVSTLYVRQNEEKMIREGMETEGKSIAMSLSLSGAKVVIENLFLIQESLGNFSRFPDVLEILFIDENSMVSAAKNSSRIGESMADDPLFQQALSNKKEYLEYFTSKDGAELIAIFEPMLLEGKIHGWIRLELSLKTAKEKLKMVTIKLTLLAILFTLIGTVLTFVFSHQIISGLNILVTQFKKMAEGDFSQKLRIRSQDELGAVTSSYNIVVDQMSHVFRKLQETSLKLNSVSQDIIKGSQMIEKGAGTTLIGSSETNQFLEKLNTSVKQVEKEIGQLTVGIEKNATSVTEVGQTTHVVAENMETFSTTVNQTIDSIAHISDGIKEINQNTDILSKASVNTAEETELLGKIIHDLGQKIALTRSFSDQSLSYAQKGVEDVQSTREGIEKIKTFGEETGKMMESLGERAKKIGIILKVINNIAQETNLLALNAAIISSQAGEHGKGFSVVASEIKDLADRTVVSTQEIKELIRVLQEESGNAVILVKKGNEVIEEGVVRANQASEALNNIIQNAQESSRMVNDINASVINQSSASNRIAGETKKVANEAVRILGITRRQEKEVEQVYKTVEKMQGISTQVKGFTVENARETQFVVNQFEESQRMILFIKNAMGELSQGSSNVLKSARNIQQIASDNLEVVKSREGMARELSHQSEELTRLTSGIKIHDSDPSDPSKSRKES